MIKSSTPFKSWLLTIWVESVCKNSVRAFSILEFFPPSLISFSSCLKIYLFFKVLWQVFLQGHGISRVKNHNLAQSITDASWGKFNTFFEYESRWQSKTYQKLERFCPSSQLCSECNRKHIMPLYLSTYVCKGCGTIFERNCNASKNRELGPLQLAFC